MSAVFLHRGGAGSCLGILDYRSFVPVRKERADLDQFFYQVMASRKTDLFNWITIRPGSSLAIQFAVDLAYSKLACGGPR